MSKPVVVDDKFSDFFCPTSYPTGFTLFVAIRCPEISGHQLRTDLVPFIRRRHFFFFFFFFFFADRHFHY